MKKLLIGLLCFVSSVATAQVDTTTLVQKVDYHIGSVAGKKLSALPPLGLTRSLQSLRNVAVTAYNWGNHAAAGYATTAQLSDYAPLSILSNYATVASLSAYATTASLANYATNAALTTGLAGKENTIPLGTTAEYRRGDKTWATLNSAAVGLGNVDNTSDINKPISSATQVALNGKEATISPGLNTQYYRGDKSWQTLNSTSVGLGNVDNTSDANKPVSTATQTALNLKPNLAGNNSWAGDQLPDADNSRAFGSTTLRYSSVYTINVSKGQTSNSFNLTTTGSTGIVLRLQPNTNNGIIQAAGSAPAETGYKWTIDGTGAANGGLLVSAGTSAFASTVQPATNGGSDLGATSFKWNNLYANAVRGNGTLRITSGTSNSIIFSQSSDANTIGQFFANTGALGLQAPGGLLTDDLTNRLQVAGSVKATTLNLTTVPVYADNAAATTGGLAVGAIYRTSTGVLMIRY